MMKPPSQLSPAVVLALPLMLCVQLLLWVVLLPVAWKGAVDFRAFHAAGYMVRTGEAERIYAYDRQQAVQESQAEDKGMLPYLHPPYEALLFVPFSFLKLRAAMLAFLFFNLGLLCAAIWLLRQQCAEPAGRKLALLSAAFLPFSVTLLQGQDTILMLLVLAVALERLREERDFAAGLAAGLCLFRFQTALPVLLLFLLWRRWRFAAGFVLAAAGLLLLSLALVGPATMLQYAHVLGSAALPAAQQPAYAPSFTPESMPNLRGIVTAVAGSHLSPLGTYLALGALSLLLLGWAARQDPRKEKALLLAVPLALLLSYHSHLQDLSLLALPVFPALLRSGKSSPAAAAAFIAPSVAVFFPPALALLSFPLMASAFELRGRPDAAAAG